MDANEAGKPILTGTPNAACKCKLYYQAFWEFYHRNGPERKVTIVTER